jgi:hypothetical protein
MRDGHRGRALRRELELLGRDRFAPDKRTPPRDAEPDDRRPELDRFAPDKRSPPRDAELDTRRPERGRDAPNPRNPVRRGVVPDRRMPERDRFAPENGDPRRAPVQQGDRARELKMRLDRLLREVEELRRQLEPPAAPRREKLPARR